MTDPALLSAAELSGLYASGRLSPVEATQASLGRIERLDARVNAICGIYPEEALASARQSEARWREGRPLSPIDGVPTTVKDLLLTRGWPTLRGSKTIDPAGPWDQDAPAVARLREAGAVLVGRTTTPEFGWKGVTDSALTGITRNPWDLTKTPGGSSGGAAVAAATGMAALNIGTDGGGSIRIPAGFTGIFGHKPSFGRVPAFPLSPFGTVSHLGPMTRTVRDAALMLSVLAQPDPRDWTALPFPPTDFTQGLEDGVRGLRVAYAPTLDGAPVDPEIAASVAKAAEIFARLGARVETVTLDLPDTGPVFRTHWFVGAATLFTGISEEKQALIDPGLRRAAAEGAAIPLLDYTRAVMARGRMGVRMNHFHQDWDLLLMPTLPIPAFAAGQDLPLAPDGSYWADWTPFTYPFNLTQQPAASVPCGLTSAGLPIGLQIIGPMFQDGLVLRAARAFEAAQPWALPPLATA
ncbi:aspartyl-tRNA(Asn)/glutamyl-tRNA(Gln) amidotransferase subunit A [Inquilinus ginsengisoli]|uniref:Aspartyl-tRNA(Asn)/glutamyl-tRNA(Gln) amidotransferase subunit A n=1 Tax=Inquilinus ginsengisoli TaxID=363840 RepID=A0ABU1JMN7_9PROT|nr:amidase [Inquilinus ginsengisoli]MDR6289881.1 aspartyl-tRNA(Asn)/glutamyl-tRNA(Gln) amidotransferase subunit A [Inquilinus ginsengisoli]